MSTHSDDVFDGAQREWETEPEPREDIEYDYDEPGEEVDNWY